MWLGAHIGIADGLADAPATGKRIGCEAIQIFSKSPQMWKGPPLAAESADGFIEAVRREGLRATAVHHGYLVNLASPKKAGLTRSRRTFQDELERAERLKVDFLIFHPGAHLGSGPEAGLKLIAESLNAAFDGTAGYRVRVLLENAAGQGTALGSAFTELRTVLDALDDPSRAGVAIDTCHLFASGVDFRGEASYGAAIDRLDRELGVERVFAFHLNDSKAGLGAHLDRHENIGKGELGLEGFRPLVNDQRWARHPGFLETPLDAHDYARYVEDLATLRGLVGRPAGAQPTAGGRRSSPARLNA